MIILHVSSIMKRVGVYCSIFVGYNVASVLYNKQNNTRMFGNMKIISRVEQDISFVRFAHL